MACDTPIGAPVTVAVAANSGTWLDTGLMVNAGECLQITALGTTVKFGVSADQCAYPEGYYSAAGSPCAVLTYDPTAVLAAHGGDPPDAYVAVDQPSYCLLAQIAATQPSGTHLTGTLRPNRGTVFPAATVGAGGRVWLILNDNLFADNSGFWTVTLQRLTTVSGTGAVISLGNGSRPSPLSEQVYRSLAVSFPNGYQQAVDLSTTPGLFHTDFTSVRVRGPYRGFLVGSILHIVSDSGELASGTALDGVDILRIGT